MSTYSSKYFPVRKHRIPDSVLALLFSLVAVLAMPTQAVSQESLREMVVVSSTFPPYCIGGENDKPDGIYIKIMEEILRPLGAVPRFHIVPFKRALALLADGQADAMIGLFRSPEREKYYHFLNPPYNTKSFKAFYVAKGRGAEIKTYQDLYKLQAIGVGAGAKFFSPFDEDTKLKKDEAPNGLIGLKKLVSGRLDAVLLTEDSGDYLIANFNLHDKVEKAHFKHSDVAPAYVCLSKKSPWVARDKELSEQIARMVKSGRMEEIRLEYLKQLPAAKRP
ncbi:MAG: transporter substrate-binding domain-containing protein [Desulfovibrio sp.]|nr:transporter substrate-binding domain-containing protein [Desulfovibrio sp.]MBI4958032.1 transporter substrate-binding domain-containing protein [Desulfovibrio sp.]